MKLTIAFITARAEPMLGLLTDGLATQMIDGDDITVLVIDALARDEFGRSADDPELVSKADADRFYEIRGASSKSALRIRAMPPKPNLWQGAHRIAPRNYFANANARNTALVYCEDDYIAFLDDRTTLGPTWLARVRQGELETRESPRLGRNAMASVLCGPVDKHLSGVDTAWGPISYDHRAQHAPHGKLNCGGAWCFGANFALPLAWALEVGGVEEGCDPVGCEDYIFGSMLQNRGHRLDFVMAMAVSQDRRADVHAEGFPRIGKGPSGPADKSQVLTRRYRDLSHTIDTPDLRALRELVRRGEPLPVPDPNVDHRDWYDGELVRDYRH